MRARRSRSVRPLLALLAAVPLAAGLLTATTTPAAAAVGGVVINEVESNGGTPGDWVELKNTAATPVDVSGWQFKDADDTHAAYVLPAGTTIAAGGYLVLEEAQFGYGLGGTESARLWQADGTSVVDSHSWTAHANPTYGRCPDGTGELVTTTTSTKGAANDCSSPVRINEVESNGDTTDWIELANPSAAAVSVGGFQLKDDGETNTVTIPAGTTIAPGGVAAFDMSGLGGADTARVLDGATPVDSYTWATHATTTYGRCPDGVGSFTTTTASTKGAVNDCGVAGVGSVKVNEVESDGDTFDWIELTNTGAAPVALDGWVLKDNDDTESYVVPAGTTLAAGGFVAFDVNAGSAAGDFGLGGADSARVFAPGGTTLVDSYSWTSHAVGTTYGRCPDGSGAFQPTTASTKGAANDCAPQVVINEVESNGGSPVDWVELKNVGPTAVDVTGWRMKDNDDTRTFAIPTSAPIPSGGHLAVDVDVAGGFGLGGADSARLYRADGTTLVDSSTWTVHAPTTTYGRCPDGTGSFAETKTPTKGAANDCHVSVPTGLVINEVESNGGTPGDWVELKNTGASPLDLGGLTFRDNDPTHAFYAIPAGTTLAAGGYFLLEEAQFGFGLGTADSATVYAADARTVVASYSWTAHAATTYGRCPDGIGDLTTTTSSTKGAANDCSLPVRINEVESNGGTPGDWVELINNGATPVDVSGWRVKDSGEPGFTLPVGTTIAAGGYLVVEEAQLGSGLGGGDSVRVFAADGTTLVDSHTWTVHASTTYGRCPNGSGAFATTQTPTKGAANVCPGDIVAGPWPGGSAVTEVDPAGTFTTNMSGLAYEPSGTTAPGVLWAVKNGAGTLYKMVRTGTSWAPATGEWASGKTLRYPAGTGDPDAEGVAFTGAGSAAGLYVATERDNSVSGTSRPAILRFDPNAAGPISANAEWNLTADLPTVGANLGLEGIAWVPDSYLTAAGFKDERTGAAYDPATYPGHGSGLFLVTLEANGTVYAYALSDGGTSTRVATFASGFPGAMELAWDTEEQRLWVVCDDTCSGRSALFEVGAQGTFAATSYVERPSGMANLNNEGFTVAPRLECAGGVKPAFWSDDNGTGGHAIRQGTVSCTDPVAQTVAFTGTLPAAAVVGQTFAPAATGGPSGQPVTLTADGPCTLAGGVVTLIHPGTCTLTAAQAGDADHLPGSATHVVTVARAATTTELTVLADRLTAAVDVVAPGAAALAGDVVFSYDGTTLGSAPIVDGVAVLTQTVPAGAARQVRASYAGSDDLAGSSDTVERRDPTITAAVASVPASGWYDGPVTVTFACAAVGSPLATPCPAPVVLSGDGVGRSATGTVTAEDGGAATVTVTGIDIDATAPVVRITGVRANGLYAEDEPAARCAATDALSGVASCRLTSRTIGSTVTLTATATDEAGNTRTATMSYRVDPVFLEGASAKGAGYVVRRGSSYRLVVLVASGTPKVLGPVKAGKRPGGKAVAMKASGSLHGLRRYVLTVRVGQDLERGRKYDLGVVTGGATTRVRLSVR